MNCSAASSRCSNLSPSWVGVSTVRQEGFIDGQGQRFNPDIKRIGRAVAIDPAVREQVETGALAQLRLNLSGSEVRRLLAENKVGSACMLLEIPAHCYWTYMHTALHAHCYWRYLHTS